MEDIYEITMLTPIGPEKGKISFCRQENKFTGKLVIMGNTKDISGSFQEGEFVFHSELRKLLTKITFTAKGKIDQDTLNAIADSNFGEIKITGKKIAS